MSWHREPAKSLSIRFFVASMLIVWAPKRLRIGMYSPFQLEWTKKLCPYSKVEKEADRSIFFRENLNFFVKNSKISKFRFLAHPVKISNLKLKYVITKLVKNQKKSSKPKTNFLSLTENERTKTFFKHDLFDLFFKSQECS